MGIETESEKVKTTQGVGVNVDELLDALCVTIINLEYYINHCRDPGNKGKVRESDDYEALGFKKILDLYNKYCDPLKRI